MARRLRKGEGILDLLIDGSGISLDQAFGSNEEDMSDVAVSRDFIGGNRYPDLEMMLLMRRES